MSDFDIETTLNQVDELCWEGQLSDQWNIGNNPNGGYLLAVTVRAVAHLFPEFAIPVSVTSHYLRPGLSNHACRIDVNLIRRGRTMGTASANFIQDGKIRLTVIAVFGLAGDGVLTDPPLTLNVPHIPPPEKCVQRSGDQQGVELPIRARLDTRLHPDQALAGQAGKAKVSGWIRFKDQRPPDCLSLLMFSDAFPPSVFGLFGNIGWVPTVELTVHVRRAPAPGWILGEFSTEDLQDGRIIESGNLWDEAGHLVAQSRQIALLLPSNQ
ncbi:MAG: thioesterase family protein [Oceanicoccus sp.]